MQSDECTRKGIPQIVKELGLRGLYTGMTATMFRDIPFNAMYFSLYAFNKEKFKDAEGNLGGFRLLAAGALAGNERSSSFLYPVIYS